jgi:hypothetical protein
MKEFEGFFSLTQSDIDRNEAVVRGVSVVRLGEAKGHDFALDHESLKQIFAVLQAKPEGVKVRVDHPPEGSNASVWSNIGFLKNFALEGDRIRADLYLFKSDPRTPKFLEMANMTPGNFGLSIHFQGDVEEIDGKKYLRCKDVFGCDLVDNPAANPSGLFSAKSGKKEELQSDEEEAMSKKNKKKKKGDDAEEEDQKGEGEEDEGKMAEKKKKEKDEDDHYSKYGDVEYADEEHHKYPIDTEEHVRAAWSYFNQERNNRKYDSDPELKKKVRSRIIAAAKKFGIDISDENDKKESEKKMTELINELDSRIKKLEREYENQMYLAQKAEIDSILLQCSREGKVLPLDKDDIYKFENGKLTVLIPPETIKKMAERLEAGRLSVKRTEPSFLSKDKSNPDEFRQSLAEIRERNALALGIKMLNQR